MKQLIVTEIAELGCFEISKLIKELAVLYTCRLLDDADFSESCMSNKFDIYMRTISNEEFLKLYKYVLDYSFNNFAE